MNYPPLHFVLQSCENKLLHIPLSLHIVYGREKMCFDFYIKYKNIY